MKEKIRNISSGGVYIETAVPFDVGTHLDLVFAIPGRPGQYRVKGIVRWANRGDDAGRPVGMGIEFLEVATSTREAIREYVAQETSKQILEPLLKTALHRNLLRIYGRKVGEQYGVDVLAEFLGCTKAALLDTVREFAKRRLMAYSNDVVSFLRPEDGELAEAVERWVRTESPDS